MNPLAILAAILGLGTAQAADIPGDAPPDQATIEARKARMGDLGAPAQAPQPQGLSREQRIQLLMQAIQKNPGILNALKSQGQMTNLGSQQ